MTLLEKARKINRLLQRSESVEYDGVARALSNVLDSNVYITNEVGQIQGYAFIDDFECDLMVDKVIRKGAFPQTYVAWLLRLDETTANMHSKEGKCAYDDVDCIFEGKTTTIVPIYGVGDRIGTLVIARYAKDFVDDDLLLAEYAATVVGMRMLRDREKKMEIEIGQKAAVRVAIHTLSYSEQAAAKGILQALSGTEGRLVASRVADELKITRSVIVNALRKFESAGVIESKSLGMKGTYIKIKNDYLLDEVLRLDVKVFAEDDDRPAFY